MNLSISDNDAELGKSSTTGRRQMPARSDDPGLTIELLREIEAEALARPVLQAIAIYDCEATRESIVVLEHKVDIVSVVLTFKEEAGPVVRWFFKLYQPRNDPFEHFQHKVAPINRYGCAVVMSSRTYRAYEKLMQEEASAAAPSTASALNILLPRVYDLNKDKRHGKTLETPA